MKRKEAMFLGITTFEGSPCRICGNKIRRTVNGECLECRKRKNREAMAIYRAARKSRIERETENG